MPQDQEYARKTGRIYREYKQGIRHADLAEYSCNRFSEKDQQGSDPPGQAKGKHQEWDEHFLGEWGCFF
jgi:hypothetical protein